MEPNLSGTSRILRILAVMAFLASTAAAQHYHFRHFGPEEGLSTAITGLLQDRAGFIWVGSSNGLFRYDGSRFQRYAVEDGLPSVSIRALHESADGPFGCLRAVVWRDCGTMSLN